MPRPHRNPNDLDSAVVLRSDDVSHPDHSVTDLYQSLTREAISRGFGVRLGSFDSPAETVLLVQVAAGANTRELWVDERNAAQVFEMICSEWQYVDGYEAAWSASCGCIEAQLESASTDDFGVLMSRLHREGGRITVEDGNGIQLGVGAASSEARAFLGACDREYCVTLRISGLSLTSHDMALSVLENLGMTFLFDLDRARSHLLVPVNAKASDWAFSSAPHIKRHTQPTLQFPAATVRGEALDIYIYARMLSNSLALEKYLSFYHVIEYFFPTYTRMYDARELQEALQDSRFDKDSVESHALVLDGIYKRRARTDAERLQRTLEECLPNEGLEHFLESTRVNDNSLSDALVQQGEHLQLGKALSEKVNSSATLAARITQIRNGIAHAKGEDSGQKYISKRVSWQAISADLTLIQYVAESVLSASTSRRPVGAQLLGPSHAVPGAELHEAGRR